MKKNSDFSSQMSINEHCHRVVLNVGGVRYETSKATLAVLPDSLLGRMFAADNKIGVQRDSDGSYFFDRNGRLFEYVLDIYRCGGRIQVPECDRDRLATELEFWNINCTDLAAAETALMQQEEAKRDAQVQQQMLHVARPAHAFILQAVGCNARRFFHIFKLLRSGAATVCLSEAGFEYCAPLPDGVDFASVHLTRPFFTNASRFDASATRTWLVIDIDDIMKRLTRVAIHAIVGVQLCVETKWCSRERAEALKYTFTVCLGNGVLTTITMDAAAVLPKHRLIRCDDPVEWTAPVELDASAMYNVLTHFNVDAFTMHPSTDALLLVCNDFSTVFTTVLMHGRFFKTQQEPRTVFLIPTVRLLSACIEEEKLFSLTLRLPCQNFRLVRFDLDAPHCTVCWLSCELES